MLATAKVFYLAGFSLSLGEEVTFHPYSHPNLSTFQVVNTFLAAARHGHLVVNLSAVFVCRDFTEQLLDSMRQAKPSQDVSDYDARLSKMVGGSGVGWIFVFQQTSFSRQSRLVVGNREEVVGLYLSMVGKQEGKQGNEDTKMGLEEMVKEIASATFSTPDQKLVVTGGAQPMMVVSTDKVSYVEVKWMMPKK